MIGRFTALMLLAAASSALAQGGDVIEVRRGPNSTVFGSCVPSLLAHNRSRLAVDYVQVDLEFSLRDGRTHRHEFKSSYRHGASQPIAANATRPLVIHADESQPLKAACTEIVGVRVVDAICETDGKPCPTPISVRTGR
ncbi:MAG: hypothetical protein KF889_09910 [Alphaproteobacteria bacterium]|nr:hypothetical protein [Alphaproteobacteria bacterium]MCW5741136.1 hypothetical protein [Alphaproteobacteria bacterium]